MKRNEAAHDLTRQRSSRSFVGAEPSFGTTKLEISKFINESIHTKSKEWWQTSPGKEFLKEQRSESTRDLLSTARKTVKMIVGLLADHWEWRSAQCIATLRSLYQRQ